MLLSRRRTAAGMVFSARWWWQRWWWRWRQWRCSWWWWWWLRWCCMSYRDALLKMQDVYRQNVALGDPTSLDPQLEENAQKLDQLQKEVTKYQVRAVIIFYLHNMSVVRAVDWVCSDVWTQLTDRWQKLHSTWTAVCNLPVELRLRNASSEQFKRLLQTFFCLIEIRAHAAVTFLLDCAG